MPSALIGFLIGLIIGLLISARRARLAEIEGWKRGVRFYHKRQKEKSEL